MRCMEAADGVSQGLTLEETTALNDIVDWFVEEANKDPFFLLHQIFVDPDSKKSNFHWFIHSNGK